MPQGDFKLSAGTCAAGSRRDGECVQVKPSSCGGWSGAWTGQRTALLQTFGTARYSLLLCLPPYLLRRIPVQVRTRHPTLSSYLSASRIPRPHKFAQEKPQTNLDNLFAHSELKPNFLALRPVPASIFPNSYSEWRNTTLSERLAGAPLAG